MKVQNNAIRALLANCFFGGLPVTYIYENKDRPRYCPISSECSQVVKEMFARNNLFQPRPNLLEVKGFCNSACISTEVLARFRVKKGCKHSFI